MINSLTRILVLAACEPATQPELQWVIEQCARLARTDVLCYTNDTRFPAYEYDDVVYIERLTVRSALSKTQLGIFLASRLLLRKLMRRKRSPNGLSVRQSCDDYGFLQRLWVQHTLRQRARAISIPPQLVIAYGLAALAASNLVRTRYKCAVIYVPVVSAEVNGPDKRADWVITKLDNEAARLIEQQFLQGAAP